MAIIAIASRYRGADGVIRPSGGGGGVSWLTPRGVPGFSRMKVIPPGTPQFRGLMGLAIAAGRRGLGDLAPCQPGFVRDPKPGGGCWDLSTMCPPGSDVCPPGTWAVAGINVPWGQYALPGAGGVIPGIPLLDPSQTSFQQLQSEQAAGIAPVIPIPVNVPPPVARPPAAGSSPTGGGGGTQGAIGSGVPGNQVAIPVSLTFVNTSRAGMPLQVGDNWSLTIMGSANTPVTADATQNGKVIGRGTAFGNTDSTGKLVLTGTMTADTVGQWNETFYVGSLSAGLSFVVAAATAGNSPAPPQVTGGGGGTPTDTSPSGTAGDVSTGGNTTAATCFSFIPSQFAQYDHCVGPVSMLTGLVIVAAAWFMFGRGRR